MTSQMPGGMPPYQPYQPVPAPKRRHRIRNALIGAGVLLVAFIALGAALSGGKKPPPPAVTPTAAAAPAVAVSTPPPPSPPSAAQQIQQWDENGGAQGLAGMITALGQVSTSTGSFTAMQGACVSLGSAIAGLQSDGPIPYAPAEKWLARALAKYSEAAADCQAGTQAQSASMLDEAVGLMSKGDGDLAKATAAIKSLGG